MDFVFKGWSFERGADGSVSIRARAVSCGEALSDLSILQIAEMVGELREEHSVCFEPEEWADIVAAVSRSGLPATPEALALHMSGRRPR